METKKCKVCKEEKPVTEFHRCGAGYQSRCKNCRREIERSPEYTPTPRKSVKLMPSDAVKDKVAALSPRLRMIAAKWADRNEAEDAFQHICEYLLTHMRPDDEESRYLATAKLEAKHTLNKARTYSFYVGDENSIGSVGMDDDGEGYDMFEIYTADSTSAEDEAIRRQEIAAIQQAISSLTPENQKVVSMLYSGYKSSEIADELGVSRAAISLRLDKIAISLQGFGLTAA